MKTNCIPVILSGGSGSRLWPLSRASRPKQFLGVTEQRSLFQLTLGRVRDLLPAAAPIVVTNHEHRFMVAEQCQQMQIKPGALVLEPAARNTAPAIAVAAFVARQMQEDPTLLVLPSDHVVANGRAFQEAMQAGWLAADHGALVTFGVVPSHPETGYGYIKAKPSAELGKLGPVLGVEAFVEKPDLERANQYFEQGGYFWNSGMFMFRASVYLSELHRHRPEMHRACEQAVLAAKTDLDFLRIDPAAFCESPSDSIDYAVMEKTERAAVVPLDAGWSDVGAWSAVWQVLPQDSSGNVTQGDVLAERSRNCYARSDGRLVALLGVEDLIVVATSDAVLVANKGHDQDVKHLVERLKQEQRSEAEHHPMVFRPWGHYELIDRGARYQVKRITVSPGAKLSLQLHHHRSEHWVVVTGTAKVTLGDQEKLVAENESVYIPIGSRHSLENPGKVPLELIEIQSGSYLGEDDIVRLEDRYGRS